MKIERDIEVRISVRKRREEEESSLKVEYELVRVAVQAAAWEFDKVSCHPD